MDASEILATLVQRYPGLLPQDDRRVNPEEQPYLVRELTILIGSWDQVDNYIPPECGHARCNRNWVETKERKCLAPGCDPNPYTPCDDCEGPAK